MTLSGDGKIGVEGTDGPGHWLWERFTHTQHEFELRGMGPPAGFLAQAHVPRHCPQGQPPESECYQKRRRPEPGQLFKYGKKRDLESALNDGILRFSGASTYSDPSLNPAIQDDELSFTIFPTSPHDGLAKCGVCGFPLLQKDGSVSLTHPTDYYVQCFSQRYSLRMFEDFGVDSCLVVYDAKAYLSRFMEALRRRFPDWITTSVPVSYVDPDDPGSDPLPIPLAKHIRYVYQCEGRMICHPKAERIAKLDPVMISVGPLSDIAEIVTLK